MDHHRSDLTNGFMVTLECYEAAQNERDEYWRRWNESWCHEQLLRDALSNAESEISHLKQRKTDAAAGKSTQLTDCLRADVKELGESVRRYESEEAVAALQKKNARLIENYIEATKHLEGACAAEDPRAGIKGS